MGISNKDREILREIAIRQAEFAHSEKNSEILEKWQALGRSERITPTVRLLFSNFTDEVIDKRLRCEGQEARGIERSLLSTLVGRELFDDDTPIPDTYNIPRRIWAYPFDIRPDLSRPESGKRYVRIAKECIERYWKP